MSAATGAPQMEERYPGIKSRMTEAGKLRRGLAAFVNDQSPNAGLQTTVGPEDEIYFAPAIAGGSAPALTGRPASVPCSWRSAPA